MSKLLTTKEAAQVCGCTPETMRWYRMMETGPAYHQMNRRSFRYAEEDVLAWLASRRIVPVRAHTEANAAL